MTPNAQEAIASYVTDMVALEQHVAKALAGQIEDLEGQSAYVQELRSIHGTCVRHSEALEDLAERREHGGQGVAGAVKKAASSVLGVGAAAIDFVRTEKLPKNLRDDYAAVSLATIGYVMLHTTALSLNDQEVADMAQRFLEDHAKSQMTLQSIIPAAVVQFLQEDGLPARADVLEDIDRTIQSAWRSGDVPAGTR